ncbi:MAG TPA: DegT/DnrJ/EryC1/StrS family aminotransferase [Actinophytocola sp.]|uniref:DegT/DnrJ/EryC1/StrS family aminotransferase n=1 Tax=Actinophytocola sp. TaxID=1872138 RepID=UPI002E0352E0|nr:DegT/DnrJ/EryC1/StrS family aminotransferase [Actinophytocola sp.]
MTDGAPPAIPYARPYWDGAETEALLEALGSGMWTNGARVTSFEAELERLAGTPAVTLSSGTAAVWALLHVLGRRIAGPKLLVTPALTFAAAPASARLLGWDVALCDVTADGLTAAPDRVAELLDRVRHRYGRVVVMPVHYAGHPADMLALQRICLAAGADLVEDACHATGARYDGTDIPVGAWPGSLAAFFSFHPTKPVASGEGGAVVSSSPELLAEVRAVRNHNMTPVAAHQDDLAPWPYTIPEPGLNLRLSDLHAAVGLVQARRAEESRVARARLAARYHDAFDDLPGLRTVPRRQRAGSAHHLFPVVFDLAEIGLSKPELIGVLRDRGVGCQVHYTPLHRLPAFAGIPAGLRSCLDTVDAAFPGLVSLPLWRGLTDADQDRVIEVVTDVAYGKHSGRCRG